MYLDEVKEAAAYIRAQLNTEQAVETAIVLGSGLNELADQVLDAIVVPYTDVPHMACATQQLHAGNFVFGSFEGHFVAMMQGRLHYYEGHSMAEVTFPIRVLAELGVTRILMTNVTGAINEQFDVGDIIVITDHINFMGENPLRYEKSQQMSLDFPDLCDAYSPRLRALAYEAGRACGEILQEGVYVATAGPSFETPAEIRAFRIWGADVVGMSTVPEVIVARACNMEVLVLSLVSNMAAGVLDQPLTLEEIVETGQARACVLGKILAEIVAKL